MEKPLVGRFRLPRVRPGGKAPNRELPPKSGDITCMAGVCVPGILILDYHI